MILKDWRNDKLRLIIEEDGGAWVLSVLSLAGGGPYMGYSLISMRVFYSLKEAEDEFEKAKKQAGG